MFNFFFNEEAERYKAAYEMARSMLDDAHVEESVAIRQLTNLLQQEQDKVSELRRQLNDRTT